MRRLLLGVVVGAVSLLVVPAVASASVSPQSIAFGSTTQNVSVWVEFVNDTSSDWYVYDWYSDGTAFSMPYDSCYGASLGQYGSCWVEVQFDGADTSIADQTYYDWLEFEHYDYGSQTWSYDYVSLLGTKPGEPGVSVSPGQMDFGPHADAVIQTVTVTNASNEPVDVSNASVNGGAPFSISADACGKQVPSGGSCNIDVRFDPSTAPSGAGRYDDSLNVSWDGSHAQQAQVRLTGEVPPSGGALDVSPGRIRFGRTSGVKTQTVTVTETTAGAQAQVEGLSAGAASGAFSIASDHCSGQILSAGQQCTFAVRFQPTHRGRFRGKVHVIATTAKGEYAARLSGTGTAGRRLLYISRGHVSRRHGVRFSFRAGIRDRVRGGAYVTVQVWSARFGRLVRQWTFHPRRSGIHAYRVRWNGRTSRGRRARPGLYRIHATILAPDVESEGVLQTPWHTIRLRRHR